jgi:hypothetical protein
MKELIEGIGTAVGSAIGLGIVALKQFNIWPFNMIRRAPQQTQAPEGQGAESSSNNVPASRHRRRHARAWNRSDDYLAIELPW